MDTELLELEELKLKVTNLIAQRQLIVQTLVILIGSTIGVLFMEDNALKYFLFILGISYIGILGKEFYKTNKELMEHLYKQKRKR